MKMQLGVYEATGRLVMDFSALASNVRMSTGPHGLESLVADLSLSVRQAARWYSDRRTLEIRASYGPLTVWRGRLEDVAFTSDGLSITAYGAWTALGDSLYTALWSDDSVAEWVEVTGSNNAGFWPERFEKDNNNRLYLAPRKDELYSSAIFGGWTYETQDKGTRPLKIVQFDYILDAATDWTAQLLSYDQDSYTGGTILWTKQSAGALLSGSECLALATSRDRLIFRLYYNNAIATLFGGETGSSYFRVTGLRLATTTTNQVNTTLGTTILAGTRTVTPPSMANIFIGQKLIVGGASTERVTVTATTATTFSAIFAFDHNTADTVYAIVVYADEIVKDVLAETRLSNPSLLSASTDLIESPRVDMQRVVYNDVAGIDLLPTLESQGDVGDDPPALWEVGVFDNERLHFRPRGAAGQTWYVDIAEIELERSLAALVTAAYAQYRDADGHVLRTETARNAETEAVYGLARESYISVDTTSEAQALIKRDAYLVANEEPAQRTKIKLQRLFTAGGAGIAQWRVRTGDTLVVRNIPRTLFGGGVFSFHVGHTEFDFETAEVEIEATISLPSLEAIVSGASFMSSGGGVGFGQAPPVYGFGPPAGGNFGPVTQARVR